MSFEPTLLNQNLGEYYKRLFPFKAFCKWMCYGQKPSAYFAFREFAFILEDDVHLRYRSFGDAVEFERELCKANPHKLDIGAVYNHKPKDNKKFTDFRPVERELVFDVDLTDYDDIRKCCSEAKVCPKCWRWITVAVLVMDYLLKNHFNFEHRLWVFSGRRGVHCWVADKTARTLTNNGRSAVAEYLSLIVGEMKTVNIERKRGFVHPLMEETYKIIMESGEFDKMVIEQGWMADSEINRLVSGCSNTDTKLELSSILSDIQSEPSNEARWSELKKRLDPLTVHESGTNGNSQSASREALACFQGFVLYHAYPRLDVNVSTGTNHLLKSPFCIHPKTGRVAVPVTAGQITHIAIDSIPRVDHLITELSTANRNASQEENRKVLEYKHTSLAPFIETFETFVDGITKESRSGLKSDLANMS